jgi:hypothetical protein
MTIPKNSKTLTGSQIDLVVLGIKPDKSISAFI